MSEPTVGGRKKGFRSIGVRSHCLLNRLGSAANESDVGPGIRAIHPSMNRIVAAAVTTATAQSSERQRAEADSIGCFPIKEDRSA
jgi:hypothetical protein